jgi:hypothetical protein
VLRRHVAGNLKLEILMARTLNPWLKLGLDAWSLGVEASSVIALRTMKMAAGGAAADAEGRRMVDEKVAAGLEWQGMALTGGLGLTPHHAAARTLAHYRRKVQANQRRLLKG